MKKDFDDNNITTDIHAMNDIEKLNTETCEAHDHIIAGRGALRAARSRVLDAMCNPALHHNQHAKLFKIHKRLLKLDEALTKSASVVLCCGGAK